MVYKIVMFECEKKYVILSLVILYIVYSTKPKYQNIIY